MTQAQINSVNEWLKGKTWEYMGSKILGGYWICTRCVSHYVFFDECGKIVNIVTD